MTPTSKDSIICYAAGLAMHGRWRSLKQLSKNSKLSGKSKKTIVQKNILKCLSSPPFAIEDSCSDLKVLAKYDSKAACSCAFFRAGMTIVYKHILQNDLSSANRQAQTALVALADIMASADEDFTGNDAEEIVSQSKSLVNFLASQAELRRAITSYEIPKKAVFILGMHRSGTSALTGMLAQAGLSAPLDLMPAGPENPKGFWESMSIYQENDRFLGEMGFHWSSSLSLPSGWPASDAAREWRSELIRLILKAYKSAHCPLIKDPRFCILMKGLEPWLESDLFDPIFLIPVRHPIEVARSLEKAQNLPLEHGLKLWIKSLFDAERATRTFKRQFVIFSDLINAPSEILRKCTDLIGAEHFKEDHRQFGSAVGGFELSPDSVDFIDPSLQHQNLDSSSADWSHSNDMLTESLSTFALNVFAEVSSPAKGIAPECIFETLRLESLHLLS
jgi:hypothetical protein